MKKIASAIVKYAGQHPAVAPLILIGLIGVLALLSSTFVFGGGSNDIVAEVIDNETVAGDETNGFVEQYYPKVRFAPPVGKPREAVIRDPRALRSDPWELGTELPIVYSYGDLKRVRLPASYAP